MLDKVTADANPCLKDPCRHIAKAIVNTCKRMQLVDFECSCQHGSTWNYETNACHDGNSDNRMLSFTILLLYFIDILVI